MPPRMRQAFGYWHRIRAGRPMPSRADLDPLDIPSLLSNMVLVDVIHLPAKSGSPPPLERGPSVDFQFRLIGTEIASRSAHDYTGRRFDDIPHMAAGTPFWRRHEDVVSQKRPLFGALPYVGPDRTVRTCHNLLAPLSRDGTVVNMILTFVTFGLE
ncbi:hypothetical protein N825_29655 [Skermanella stibiiresistens SB22]|uniref:PAS domain-containing protein n=2 Tax=Skermanella TaxID=204447 RepID=W9GQW7_9PROT|nr:hypothetical protein N825_29655 [Skermanella stibiiresistens SB22]